MNKYMTVDALLVLARDKYDDSESELRAAIKQYGREQHAQGVNDAAEKYLKGLGYAQANVEDTAPPWEDPTQNPTSYDEPPW